MHQTRRTRSGIDRRVLHQDGKLKNEHYEEERKLWDREPFQGMRPLVHRLQGADYCSSGERVDESERSIQETERV